MIRIETARLVQLLGDLVHTAARGSGGASEGVLLHSERADRGDEPGQTDLLVGTSTNARVIGQCHVDAYGRMARPMLWPLADVRAVIAAYKPKLAEHREHTVEIRRDADMIVISEDPHLFGDGLTVRFSDGPVADYPRVFGALREVPRLLDEWGSLLPRTDFSPSLLEPFNKVAKSRGELVQTYRYHQRSRVLVQIGQRYRGAIHAHQSWDTLSEGSSPDGDVFEPDLPVADEE
ncbi:hypothetical protein [Prauserella flavalba]|uniref:Uncharacterized protein n=1 Tax=Prauserella flavalba TaxID=1477506 RepID=A0A318LXK7_9PSEU|nr:hypothetical protein [Prauserella flavalba]PXY17363.1 hypothetical protein BA062_37780 [Prauserella flavalba]